MVEALQIGATQSFTSSPPPESASNGGHLFSGFIEGSGINKGKVRPLPGIISLDRALRYLSMSPRQTEHGGLVAAWHSLITGVDNPHISEEELVENYRFAANHDIGKSAFSFVDNSGLTLHQKELMHQHPTIAAEILGKSRISPGPEAIPYLHHERIDRRGYPLGLSASAIPVEVKRATTADIITTMTRVRPWDGHIFTPEDAVLELQIDAGTILDPKILETTAVALAYLVDGTIFEHYPHLNGLFHREVKKLATVYKYENTLAAIENLPAPTKP